MSEAVLNPLPHFGQVVIGPPAAGKTSYCDAMASLLRSLGRKVAVINFDPANDTVPYECALSITDLVTVSDTMAEHSLGPNGAILYCMETLLANPQWILNKLKGLRDHYLILDFPGQVELYTHQNTVKDFLTLLDTKGGVKLTAVYLMDAHHTTDIGKYMCALLQTLSSVIHMELPAVNLLTKVDLVDKYGTSQMPLEFYTDVLDLEYLLNDAPFTKKYSKMNKSLADVITNYGLVSYVPVSVDDKQTLLQAQKAIDTANGYIFGSKEERNIQRMLSCSVGAGFDHDRIGTVKDAYEAMSDDEEDLLKAYATQNPNVK